MTDNFDISKNFDVAFEKAKETLQAQGNKTPKTSEIIQAMLQNSGNSQESNMGLQVEHPQSTPVEMKYGANIPTPSTPTTPSNTQVQNEMKYGANIPTPSTPTTPSNTQTPIEMKYGANIPTPSTPTTPSNTQTPIETKYGANIPIPSTPTTPSISTPSETNPNTPDTTSYTVPKGQGYTSLIKQALEDQGIKPTAENIKKAKAQFEEINPDAIQIYHGKHKEWSGNKFLYADSQVLIPKFDIDTDKPETKATTTSTPPSTATTVSTPTTETTDTDES